MDLKIVKLWGQYSTTYMKLSVLQNDRDQLQNNINITEKAHCWTTFLHAQKYTHLLQSPATWTH